MFGPFLLGQIAGLHINLMGVVHTPGRWRFITDLSQPEGVSVNDGIQSKLCSLRYTSVESVAAAAQRLGRGALLAKLDIYRLVPSEVLTEAIFIKDEAQLCPEDRKTLEFLQTFIHTCDQEG